MTQYVLSGVGYDTILVSSMNIGPSIVVVDQYYTKDGIVQETSNTTYKYTPDKELVEVITDDTDTLILPEKKDYRISHMFMAGSGVNRIVVPRESKYVFESKSLYDIPGLTHYISLSKDTEYRSDVFPVTVTDRRF